MKIHYLKNLFSSIFILFLFYSCHGQPFKSLVSLEHKHLIAQIENPIHIVAQQKEPVSIHQLSATFQSYFDSPVQSIKISEGNGYFIIQPDSIGIVELKIKIGDTIETKKIRVKAIEAVGRLGRFKANEDKKIGVGEFKAQEGIIANVECCGFDAKCKVIGFETLRISKKNITRRSINQGGRFSVVTRK